MFFCKNTIDCAAIDAAVYRRMSNSSRSLGGHAMLARMSDQEDDDQYSAEETKRPARAAIRRSFEIPYKPQKDLVGKLGASKRGRPRRSRPVDQGKDQA